MPWRRRGGRPSASREGVLNQLACGKAHYRQGEVHRLRGEFEAAEEAYREASRCGCEPQPGLALLRLAQGKTDTAAAAIRRAVGETTEPLERAALLPAYVEIMLAAGEVEPARGALRELEEIAAAHGSDALRCDGGAGGGRRRSGGGRRRAALWSHCAGPLRIWQELEAPYETARARVLVGAACRALGDDDTRCARAGGGPRGLRGAAVRAPDLARVDGRCAGAAPPTRTG